MAAFERRGLAIAGRALDFEEPGATAKRASNLHFQTAVDLVAVVVEMLHANWLELERVVEMPANNLAFVSRRPG